VLVEQDAALGGACVRRGTIPSKTLRETALALEGFRRRSGGVCPVVLDEQQQVDSLMLRTIASLATSSGATASPSATRSQRNSPAQVSLTECYRSARRTAERVEP
jgi:pyruvate/2-oxoglutarate dehydrogenase complex dihydrolipoamide dehydrogenase (E3) component